MAAPYEYNKIISSEEIELRLPVRLFHEHMSIDDGMSLIEMDSTNFRKFGGRLTWNRVRLAAEYYAAAASGGNPYACTLSHYLAFAKDRGKSGAVGCCDREKEFFEKFGIRMKDVKIIGMNSTYSKVVLHPYYLCKDIVFSVSFGSELHSKDRVSGNMAVLAMEQLLRQPVPAELVERCLPQLKIDCARCNVMERYAYISERYQNEDSGLVVGDLLGHDYLDQELLFIMDVLDHSSHTLTLQLERVPYDW